MSVPGFFDGIVVGGGLAMLGCMLIDTFVLPKRISREEHDFVCRRLDDLPRIGTPDVFPACKVPLDGFS